MNARVTTVVARLTGAGLALALLGAGCGSDERGDDLIVAGDTEADDSVDAGDFVGLDTEAAAVLAERNGRPWRVARDDDQHFALTDDLVTGRVTFEIDAGVVTAAEIEGANLAPPDSVAYGTERLARLETAAIVRLVTVDQGFGTGNAPFDLVQVGTAIGGDTARPVDALALELIADTLADRFAVEFVSDTDATVAAHFDNQTMGVAVAAIDDVRIDADRAEIEMRLWCGSLCGVFLTYEAVLGSSGWEIIGTTGPIAMS
jgi:hypothetical protein